MISSRTAAVLAALVLAGWGCVADDAEGEGKKKGPGNGDDDQTSVVEGPTWHQDVAPIVTYNCTGCHTDGGVAEHLPFEGSYDDHIALWSTSMADQVDRRLMPPFYAGETEACTPRFPWLHDARLAQEDIDTIIDWALAGAPEGDPDTAAPLIPAPQYALEEWDVELEPEFGFEVTEGDNIICFPLDPGVTETKWLVAAEVLPGMNNAVHHVQLRIDYDGILWDRVGDEGWFECSGQVDGVDIGGYLPGTPPVQFPTDVAMPVEPDSYMMMQIHYYLPEDPEPGTRDRTRLRLQFGDEPTYTPAMMRIGNDTGPKPWGGLLDGPNDPPTGPAFFIPAGAKDHTETSAFAIEIPGEYSVFILANHMHYVGESARVWVEHADPQPGEPKEECLLNTPIWSFDWQQFYQLDMDAGLVPKVREGDTVYLQCTFNNTMDNDLLADHLQNIGLDEPVDVGLGAGSTDEMCAAMIGVVQTGE